MTRRILAIAAVLLLLALPATAQTPNVPPAGTVLLYVAISDGMTVLPVTSGVLPLSCTVVVP